MARYVLLLALATGVAACGSGTPPLEHEAALLSLHQTVMTAHLDGDVEPWLAVESDDYVSVNSLMPFAEDDYSITGWFQLGTTGGTQTLFAGTDENGNAGSLLQVGADGRLRYTHRYPLGTAGGTTLVSDVPVLDGWHHFAAVKSGSDLKLYVDKVLKATDIDNTVIPDGLRIVFGQLGIKRFPCIP